MYWTPSLILAYGIGRAGCHFSGDGDWGIVASNQPDWWFLPDWMWSYNYPNNVINEGIPIPGCSKETSVINLQKMYTQLLFMKLLCQELYFYFYGVLEKN